jgi:hypothetical protein
MIVRNRRLLGVSYAGLKRFFYKQDAPKGAM